MSIIAENGVLSSPSLVDVAWSEMLYHRLPHKRRLGAPYVSWCFKNIKDEQKWMNQRSFRLPRLKSVLKEIAERPDLKNEHHYISQNHFAKPNRRAVDLWSFGCAWTDIDLDSFYYSFDFAQQKAYELLGDIKTLMLPWPTDIVWSGRGLHAKWVFDAPVPALALPRWASAMRYIQDKLEIAGWPVDRNAMDVSRVLRIAGTYNPRTGMGATQYRNVMLVYQSNVLYDFDIFCDEVLPYTRDELREIIENRENRKEAIRVWQEWNENRQKANEFLRGIKGGVKTKTELSSIEAIQGLWWRRLKTIINIAVARGGIGVGQRDTWTWVAANALAWAVGDVAKFEVELPELIKKIVPTYTSDEVKASVTSVLKRLESGRENLYKMKTDTLVSLLGLTPAEAEEFYMGLGHVTHNPGIMGLLPLAGLPYDEWAKEVKRRFSLGAGYTAEQKRLKTAEKRLRAAYLRGQGLNLRQIAAELGVSHEAVRKWLAE